MAEHINRDRVVAIIAEMAVVHKMRQLHAYNKGWRDALLLAKSRILEEIPVADVRPERHGHWITRHDGLPFCSECDYNGLGYIALDLDYCPHCGAKMDGKGEE